MNDNTESKAIVLRSKVESCKNYQDYRDILRFDFWYSCAYCSMTEIEATGIGFEIDHYYPIKHNREKKNDYNNLMWSCRICNRNKADFNPDEDDKIKGNVVLRPDHDDPEDHLTLEYFSYKAKTHTGEFNIHRLDLNRLQLRRIREIRERLFDAKSYIAFGIRQLRSLKIDKIERRKRYSFSILKKKFLERHGQVVDSIDTFLKNFSKSILLDEDPEKQKRLKIRRKYLNEQKAITQ